MHGGNVNSDTQRNNNAQDYPKASNWPMSWILYLVVFQGHEAQEPGNHVLSRACKVRKIAVTAGNE